MISIIRILQSAVGIINVILVIEIEWRHFSNGLFARKQFMHLN